MNNFGHANAVAKKVHNLSSGDLIHVGHNEQVSILDTSRLQEVVHARPCFTFLLKWAILRAQFVTMNHVHFHLVASKVILFLPCSNAAADVVRQIKGLFITFEGKK